MELREELTPAGPFRLPRWAGRDGLLRRRGEVLERLLHHEDVPAGDLVLLKLVGRLLSGGDPHVRAEERQVRDFFAPYGEWAGLAATHLIAQ